MVCIQIRCWSNFAGFIFAVSFSLVVNAKFTFSILITDLRYILNIDFIGTLNAAVGWAADKFELIPIMTLITFSASICMPIYLLDIHCL